MWTVSLVQARCCDELLKAEVAGCKLKTTDGVWSGLAGCKLKNEWRKRDAVC